MTSPLTFRYRLDAETWRRFFVAHYACDHALKIRFVWGVACITIGAFGLGGLFASRILAGALLLVGLYCVLSREIFLIRSLTAARQSAHFGKEISVVLDADGIAVDTGQVRYRHRWSDFSGFRWLDPGYLLYLPGGSFFFIPRAVCTPEEEERLGRLLASAGLSPLAPR